MIEETQIVAKFMNSRNIRFFDEKGLEVNICAPTIQRFENPFSPPHLVIDAFAKKTLRPYQIKSIEFDELKKFGFCIFQVAASKSTKWFQYQHYIYIIDDLTSLHPGHKKITRIPEDHKVQYDVANNRIRLIGPNAGYPHYHYDSGVGGGPWISLTERKIIKTSYW